MDYGGGGDKSGAVSIENLISNYKTGPKSEIC